MYISFIHHPALPSISSKLRITYLLGQEVFPNRVLISRTLVLYLRPRLSHVCGCTDSKVVTDDNNQSAKPSLRYCLEAEKSSRSSGQTESICGSLEWKEISGLKVNERSSIVEVKLLVAVQCRTTLRCTPPMLGAQSPQGPSRTTMERLRKKHI